MRGVLVVRGGGGAPVDLAYGGRGLWVASGHAARSRSFFLAIYQADR